MTSTSTPGRRRSSRRSVGRPRKVIEPPISVEEEEEVVEEEEEQMMVENSMVSDYDYENENNILEYSVPRSFLGNTFYMLGRWVIWVMSYTVLCSLSLLSIFDIRSLKVAGAFFRRRPFGFSSPWRIILQTAIIGLIIILPALYFHTPSGSSAGTSAFVAEKSAEAFEVYFSMRMRIADEKIANLSQLIESKLIDSSNSNRDSDEKSNENEVLLEKLDELEKLLAEQTKQFEMEKKVLYQKIDKENIENINFRKEVNNAFDSSIDKIRKDFVSDLQKNKEETISEISERQKNLGTAAEFDSSYFEEIIEKKLSAGIDQVKDFVDQELDSYVQHGEHGFDYALRTIGGTVVEELTTPTLNDKLSVFEKIRNVLVPNSHAQLGQRSQPAFMAIDPFNYPGYCYCFNGPVGILTVRLVAPVLVDSVSYEHAVQNLLPHVESSPLKINVWGLNDPFDSELDNDPQYLGQMNYQVPGKPSQLFHLDHPGVFQYIQFQVVENYGFRYTCLYRLRVHSSVTDVNDIVW